MAFAHRILLAIADPALHQTVAEQLGAAGHRVGAWPDPLPADLVMIDDRWPDAPALCGEAKRSGATVLVLGAGVPSADDAVARPLRLGALVAKVAELLGRRGAGRRVVRLGPWAFDAAARVVEGPDGGRVRLTDKEAAILAFLAEDGGIVARDRLLAGVWGYSAAVTTHTLETHIYRLRRKLERDPARAAILLTEDGGYRLAAS